MVGEFKDDCLQRIYGSFGEGFYQENTFAQGSDCIRQTSTNAKNKTVAEQWQNTGSILTFDSSYIARTSNTNNTHGKRKGVKYIIKVL